MGIKLNRTNKNESVSALDPTNARKVLTQKFIENMGGYSSCDPHGNAMFSQSYSAPAVNEPQWAPQHSFEPQAEQAWGAPQQNQAFEQNTETSWAAPQQNESFEQEHQTTWAAPAQPVAQAWCGPQTTVSPMQQAKETNEAGAWYESLATREFEMALSLRSVGGSLHAVSVPPQSERKTTVNQLAGELVAFAAPRSKERRIDTADLSIDEATTAGIARTERGTIEYISHPTGTSIRPLYNHCGILTRIDFNDGSRFERSNGPIPWVVVDAAGHEVKEIQVKSVSIDNQGNVSFGTLDGRITVMHANGMVSQRAA